MPIGKSRVEEDKLELARELMAEAAKHDVAFVLPSDHVVADSLKPTPTEAVVNIPFDKMGLDIGPRTIADFIATPGRREDRHLERPAGILRASGFRQRHAWRSARRLRTCRRVTSCSAAAIRRRPWLVSPGRKLHPYLDRRRRHASNISKASYCRASKRSKPERRTDSQSVSP